jgi:hypothetical protein
MIKKERTFNFKWKLIENYFTALTLFFFTLFFTYGFVYGDLSVLVLAIVWGAISPFIATFLDKKSQEGQK